jgi:DegV family protein with EDD domain
MQIVTDYAADISPEQLEGFEVHYLPLMITIDGKTYRSGVDITPSEFYELQEKAKEIPTTSQPSPGDFADLYRNLAKKDPDILSIHISSGLSGTVNAARIGASAVSEANVEIYDTKTLSGAQGWHVEMAAKAVRAGWDKHRILSMLKQITEATENSCDKSIRNLVSTGSLAYTCFASCATANASLPVPAPTSSTTLSQRNPITGWVIAYAMKNPDDIKPSATPSSPRSIARSSATTDTATR